MPTNVTIDIDGKSYNIDIDIPESEINDTVISEIADDISASEDHKTYLAGKERSNNDENLEVDLENKFMDKYATESVVNERVNEVVQPETKVVESVLGNRIESNNGVPSYAAASGMTMDQRKVAAKEDYTQTINEAQKEGKFANSPRVTLADKYSARKEMNAAKTQERIKAIEEKQRERTVDAVSSALMPLNVLPGAGMVTNAVVNTAIGSALGNTLAEADSEDPSVSRGITNVVKDSAIGAGVGIIGKGVSKIAQTEPVSAAINAGLEAVNNTAIMKKYKDLVNAADTAQEAMGGNLTVGQVSNVLNNFDDDISKGAKVLSGSDGFVNNLRVNAEKSLRNSGDVKYANNNIEQRAGITDNLENEALGQYGRLVDNASEKFDNYIDGAPVSKGSYEDQVMYINTNTREGRDEFINLHNKRKADPDRDISLDESYDKMYDNVVNANKYRFSDPKSDIIAAKTNIGNSVSNIARNSNIQTSMNSSTVHDLWKRPSEVRALEAKEKIKTFLDRNGVSIDKEAKDMSLSDIVKETDTGIERLFNVREDKVLDKYYSDQYAEAKRLYDDVFKTAKNNLDVSKLASEWAVAKQKLPKDEIAKILPVDIMDSLTTNKLPSREIYNKLIADGGLSSSTIDAFRKNGSVVISNELSKLRDTLRSALKKDGVDIANADAAYKTQMDIKDSAVSIDRLDKGVTAVYNKIANSASNETNNAAAQEFYASIRETLSPIEQRYVQNRLHTLFAKDLASVGGKRNDIFQFVQKFGSIIDKNIKILEDIVGTQRANQLKAINAAASAIKPNSGDSSFLGNTISKGIDNIANNTLKTSLISGTGTAIGSALGGPIGGGVGTLVGGWLAANRKGAGIRFSKQISTLKNKVSKLEELVESQEKGYVFSKSEVKTALSSGLEDVFDSFLSLVRGAIPVISRSASKGAGIMDDSGDQTEVEKNIQHATDDVYGSGKGIIKDALSPVIRDIKDAKKNISEDLPSNNKDKPKK